MIIYIVVPLFHSVSTLPKLLASITAQRGVYTKTILVNDGGQKNEYEDIITKYSPLIDITYLYRANNMGPGHARQVALDSIEDDDALIVFADSDDNFYGSWSLATMAREFDDSGLNVLAAKARQLHGKNESGTIDIETHGVWVFAHMYRLSFLRKHNITFSNSKANEDVGFNIATHLITYLHYGESSTKEIEDVVYEWQDNPNSIVRNKKKPFTSRQSYPGFFYNRYRAYQIVEQSGLAIEQFAADVVLGMFSFYWFYLAAVQKYNVDRIVVDTLESYTTLLYYDFYKEAITYMNTEEIEELYAKSRNDVEESVGIIIPIISIRNFLLDAKNRLRKEIDYDKIALKIEELPTG